MSHYVASKGAVIGFTRSVARELANDGITVNVVSPGLTITQTVTEQSDRHRTVGGRNPACYRTPGDQAVR